MSKFDEIDAHRKHVEQKAMQKALEQKRIEEETRRLQNKSDILIPKVLDEFGKAVWGFKIKTEKVPWLIFLTKRQERTIKDYSFAKLERLIENSKFSFSNTWSISGGKRDDRWYFVGIHTEYRNGITACTGNYVVGTCDIGHRNHRTETDYRDVLIQEGGMTTGSVEGMSAKYYQEPVYRRETFKVSRSDAYCKVVRETLTAANEDALANALVQMFKS